MHSAIVSSTLVGLSYLSATVLAAPFTFNDNPVGNHFPTPDAAELETIELTAHGSLPNGAPPATITDDTKNSLRLIAFNELTEVAFFTELISNITNNVDGYHIHDKKKERYILAALTAVQAQEELHALNANNALNHFNAGPIQACTYNFPVSNLQDAIALASKFTDLVLGTLGDVVSLFGADGDSGLIRGVAAVIGQEGEQNGFYRNILGDLPSQLPFLTASTREFAFNALIQNFIVDAQTTCPNFGTIGLPTFNGTLNIVTPNVNENTREITFSFTIPAAGLPAEAKDDLSGLDLVLINQENTPVVQPLTNATQSNGVATFTAPFPFNGTTFGQGLTIAVVALSSGTLTNVDGVANATLFGPGLIEIN